MKPLLLHTSLPCAIVDTAALGDAAVAGESLPADGSASLEEKMCFVLQLLEHERTGDAAMLLDTINYNPNDGDGGMISFNVDSFETVQKIP